jgi:DNA-binding response OmpR family regulator
MKTRAAIVISRDRKERAFLRAELIEEGITALAVENISEALEWLSDPGVLPMIIIYDTNNQDKASQDLERFTKLVSRIPVLILTSSLDTKENEYEKLGFKHIIRRPVSIGELVSYVKVIIKGETQQ